LGVNLGHTIVTKGDIMTGSSQIVLGRTCFDIIPAFNK